MYSFKQIAEFCEGRLAGNPSQVDDFCNFTPIIDSRKIVNPEKTIFFAINSPTRNGEEFVENSYQAGVRFFVVSEGFSKINRYPNAAFILCADVLKALQKIAKGHRNSITKPIIAITGSNGKTIVKEWLNFLLSPELKIVRSPGSYNSQIGVPLSLWNLTNEMDYGIIEAGISKPEEMTILNDMILPEIGLLTNIGTAHIENFTQKAQILDEKLKLFRNSKLLIYCADEDWIADSVKHFTAEHGIRTFSWSLKNKADLNCESTLQNAHQTSIRFDYQGQSHEVKIPFGDKASCENAMHCLALILSLGLFKPEILKRFELLTPVEMRMQFLKGINNCVLINDSYSFDLQSIKIALESMIELSQRLRKTVILSDFPGVNRPHENVYPELASLLKSHQIHKVILIGREVSKSSYLFDGEVIVFSDTQSFLREYSMNSFRDELILVKGARSFGFERIAQILEQKNHETVLEINQNAIIHNLNAYKAIVPTGTKIMAMVKAFSYGTGGVEMAALLEYNKIDYLAVAFADEGVELRNAGIKTPIMVMSPEPAAAHNLMNYNLEPEVFSFRSLQFLLNSMKSDVALNSDLMHVHIKIDTGMHRLGFEQKDTAELCKILKANPQLRIKSVFSHLAASESAEHDDFTLYQAKILKEVSNQIKDAVGYDFLVHILNSAGIERFTGLSLDMVRLGIGIYGLDSTSSNKLRLKNALKWKSAISMIKSLPAGETVGYGRSGKIITPSRIATIPVGYADGFRRCLGNGVGKVEINGTLCPVVGNVCMDMLMVDVTHAKAEEGDEVLIFGGQITLQAFAKDSKTIPYEILTSISPRVKRIYVKGD